MAYATSPSSFGEKILLDLTLSIHRLANQLYHFDFDIDHALSACFTTIQLWHQTQKTVLPLLLKLTGIHIASSDLERSKNFLFSIYAFPCLYVDIKTEPFAKANRSSSTEHCFGRR